MVQTGSMTRVILGALVALTLVYCMRTVSVLHTSVGSGDYDARLLAAAPTAVPAAPIAAAGRVSAPSSRRVARARPGKKLAAARSRLLDRIRALQEPVDCAAARYIECAPGGGCGFGCQIHRLSSCMARAASENATAVVLDGLSRYTYGGCSRWNCAFAEASTCTEWYRAHRGGAVYNAAADPPRWLPPEARGMPRAHAWFRGHLVAFLLRPSARLGGALEAARCLTARDVGIHVRRGDKLAHEAQLYHVREYMHEVDHFVHPGRLYHSHYDHRYNITLFAATDDAGVLAELTSHDYAPYDISHSPLEHVRQAGRYNADGHLENLLCEVEQLVQTRFFVGTFSSQISRLVFELKLGRGLLHPGDAPHSVASLDEDYYT